MAAEPKVLHRKDWAREADQWVGSIEGFAIGTDVTVLFFSSDKIGAGPYLHVHDYDEIFIIRQGNARFEVGDTVIDAVAGDIVFGPAGVPHKFENLGPGRLETTDIHVSDHFEQLNLEGPNAGKRTGGALLASNRRS